MIMPMRNYLVPLIIDLLVGLISPAFAADNPTKQPQSVLLGGLGYDFSMSAREATSKVSDHLTTHYR